MIVALCGASGSGKSTVAELIQKELGLKNALKCTTRKKRNDRDTDYVFTDEPGFFEKVRRGELIEFVYYHGNFYGILTPHDECLVNCEPTGAVHVRKWAFTHGVESRLVYLDCPEEVRKARMTGRGDFVESVEERVAADRYFEIFKAGFDAVVDATGTPQETFDRIRAALGR